MASSERCCSPAAWTRCWLEIVDGNRRGSAKRDDTVEAPCGARWWLLKSDEVGHALLDGVLGHEVTESIDDAQAALDDEGTVVTLNKGPDRATVLSEYMFELLACGREQASAFAEVERRGEVEGFGFGPKRSTKLSSSMKRNVWSHGFIAHLPRDGRDRRRGARG